MPKIVGRVSETMLAASLAIGAAHAQFLLAVATLAAGVLGSPAAIAAGNDKERPQVAITAPVNKATVSGTVTVEASATDNIGVAGVQFYVDGAALGNEVRTAPYAVSWNTIGGANTHTLTAVARDAAGNRATSAPVTVSVSNVAPPVVTSNPQRYEETDPAVTYTGGWIADTSETWSGGAAQISETAGARATFTFTGPSVNWIGARAYNTGIARVYVDGVFTAEVDTYLPTDEIRVPMFTVNDLPNTTHTLTIEATGRRNALASDAWVCVDAFDVTAVSASRLQETDSAVAYSAGWTQGNTARDWSEGTAALSAVAGAQATFTFTGTAISWIGARSPQTGIASVYLDGSHVADVDTYAPAEQIQAAVFTSASLANTTHTLTIVVTGIANAASSSPLIVVDGFEVTVPGRRYQDTDPSITYAPAVNWYLDTRDHAYSEGTVAEAIFPGSATFPFVGTGVSLVSATCTRCGIIRVSIDGGAATEIDLYATTDSPQVTVFRAQGLPAGNHTVKVEVTGRKNPASAYYWVVVDAFDVVP